MLQHHNIPVTRTARFLTQGNPSSDITEVWFVLHGYAQLASDFIHEFEPLQNENRLIVAPEALSRFYARKSPGGVGASWMTKESRESEINDYLAYLNQVALYVYDMLERRAPSVVLGFSQGATTASRWVTLGRFPAKRVIFWGGDIAQDLDLQQFSRILSEMNPLLVVGEDDHYLTPERLEHEENRLKKYEIPYELITFKGGHQIDPYVLRTIV